MNQGIEAATREVLGNVLEVRIAENADLRREDEPMWDSLKHIEVVFALEDTFDVQFTPDEMARLDGVAAIAAAVRAKRASRSEA